MTEDEIVGWHPQLNGHEFEQAPGDGDGQGSMPRCSPWGRRVLDTTDRLSNNSTLAKAECPPALQPRERFLSKLAKDPLSFPIIMILG